MNKRLALVAFAAAVCLIATACGRADSGKYATDGTFTFAVLGDPGSFDPYRHANVPSFDLAYDSLVNQGPDGNFVSGLAEKWSADARSAQFTIRQNVTCSDGTRLTASQVAADLNFLGDPKNASPLFGLFIPVPLTATADDTSRTVKIAMKSPFGFVLNTIGQAPIMCAKGLRDPGQVKFTSDGTGPFVLTKVSPGESYTFTVRKGYSWGPGGAATSAPGTPAKVVMRVVSSQTTAANMLLTNELNLAPISGQDQQRLVARGLKRIEHGSSGAWLWFNHQDGRPAADERVRKALVQALDMTQLVKVNVGGTDGGPATGLVEFNPKPCPGNTLVGQLPRHDLSAAEAMLDQAGWTKDPNGTRSRGGRQLSFNVHYWTGSSLDKATTELIAQMWQALGAQVKITGDDTANLNSLVSAPSDFDILVYGYSLTLPSQLVASVSGAVPPQGGNFSGIQNAKYDAAVSRAEGLTAPAACTYWNEADRALISGLDIVPISNRPYVWFLSNAEAQSFGWSTPIPTSIRVLG